MTDHESLDEPSEPSLEMMGFTSFGKKPTTKPPKHVLKQQIEGSESSSAANTIPLGARKPGTKSMSVEMDLGPLSPPGNGSDLPPRPSFETSRGHGGDSYGGFGGGRGRGRGRGRGGRDRGGGFQNRGSHSYHPYPRGDENPTDGAEGGGSSGGYHQQQRQDLYHDPVYGVGYYKDSFVEDPWAKLKTQE